MTRKAMYPLAFAVAVAAVFVISMPVRATDADDGITSAFQKSYVYKTYLKDDSVKAEAKDGVVTLTGTVADESHKTLAQETASNLSGVSHVNNQLTIKTPVSVEFSDAWVGGKVRLALLFHRSVNVVKTAIDVKDGIVTLKGEASSIAQKELTGEYAKDVAGVKGVKNEMTVAATPEPQARTAAEKIDDASITAQVKMSLFTHHSTSSAKTKVETRDGVVTLTGIARNASEKTLVTKLVDDIQGVTSVKNEMTVEETKTK